MEKLEKIWKNWKKYEKIAKIWHRGNFRPKIVIFPGDLDTRKSTGTSCQIEIHFMIKTTEYLL